MNIEAFFKITYGLYVVSAAHEGKKNGYIGNTVFQVTAEPPQFAIACNKDNLTADIIRQSRYFSVSILEKDVPSGLIGLFGFKSGKDVDKFESVKHLTTDQGTPVLLENTVAWFECRVVQTVDVGSHLLFIAEILDNALTDAEKEPLTYAWYQQVKKGVAPKNAPTYIDKKKIRSSEKKEASAGKKYKCSVCGFVYDPAVGDPDGGIPPGTPFEDIPDDWQCPVCGVSKSEFRPLEE